MKAFFGASFGLWRKVVHCIAEKFTQVANTGNLYFLLATFIPIQITKESQYKPNMSHYQKVVGKHWTMTLKITVTCSRFLNNLLLPGRTLQLMLAFPTWLWRLSIRSNLKNKNIGFLFVCKEFLLTEHQCNSLLNILYTDRNMFFRLRKLLGI